VWEHDQGGGAIGCAGKGMKLRGLEVLPLNSK
jgi:hypothetical protein